MEAPPKIGITGLPSVGKTATLERIVKKLEEDEFRVGGMITRSVVENGTGRKVGFRVVDWRTGQGEVFAHLDFDTKFRAETEDGTYSVKPEVLEKYGVKAIRDALHAPDVDIVIIDEVGKMEMHSKAFCDAVIECLDHPKPVIMTLHKKSRNPLLQDIRRRDDVRILEVTQVNKNLLPYKIEKILKDKLDTMAFYY
jgi:nucleoside-triphosphatase